MKIHNRYKVLTILLTIAVVLCSVYIYNQHKRILQIESDLQMVQIQCEENELLYDEFCEVSKEINKVVKEKSKIKLSDPRALIKLACKESGVDPALAIAISRAETGNWTSDLYKSNNNVGGMRANGEWIKYSTLLQGVNAYVINLKKNYIDLGLTTPELIGAKYCPNNPSGWVKLVNKIMMEER